MKYIVKTEAEWHDLRTKYITASESAVLVGLNPYSSPSKLKKSTFKGNANTLLGQLLETVVVKITNIMLKTNFKLFETDEGKIFFTKGNLGATPDALEGPILLECKTTRPDLFLKHKEIPPVTYLMQLQTQLWCTGNEIGYLAILSTDLTQKDQEPNWPIVLYKVQLNHELCAIIESEAERFFKSDTFRVNSKLKVQANLLLQSSWTKVKKELTELQKFLKTGE